MARSSTTFGMGNQWWKARSRHGVKPIFPEGPEGAAKLLEACEDYFEWNEDNPLYEEKAFAYEGAVTVHESPKVRATTINGLCIFIDVTPDSWRDWRSARPDLLPVMNWAETCIKQQKFTAAAAGLLNANIISRDLGLADKTELTGPGGGPITTVNGEMTPQEAAEAYARTRDGR